MIVNLPKRRRLAETGQSVPRILLTVSLLALTLAAAWLAGHKLAAPDAPVSADRYLGVVQLAPDQQGRCEQFELDNKAGLMRSKGFGRCDDITSSTSSAPVGGAGGRLQSISEHFKSR